MGVTLVDVIENELLSEGTIDCLPNNGRCECCDAEIEFTDTLKQIYCPNRNCSYKVAARLESMAKAMKVDGFGQSTCREICTQLELVSPYQIFVVGEKGIKCDGVAGFDKKIKAMMSSPKRTAKLYEFVAYASIPGIDTIAFKLFDGYENIEAAYEDIEKYEVPFIAGKLGIKSSESSVMAVSIFNTLMAYKNELLFGEKKFKIYQATGDLLKIAITGGVYGFTNKAEFIQRINTKYTGKVNAVFMNSVTKEVNVLIADGDTNSNKYKSAMKIRNNAIEAGKNPDDAIMVFESKDFLQWLENKYSN